MRQRSYPVRLAPFIGAVVGAAMARYAPFFGGEASTGAMFFSIGLGFVAGCVIWLMDFIERGGAADRPPNATITIVLLLLAVGTFWIPLIGLAILSYALYRAKWLEVSEWALAPFGCLFFVAVAATIVGAFVASLDLLGLR